VAIGAASGVHAAVDPGLRLSAMRGIMSLRSRQSNIGPVEKGASRKKGMSMKRMRILVAAMLVLGAVPALAKDSPPPNWDGMVQVDAPNLQYTYLLPGADFKSYSKLLLGTPEAAFAPSWLKDMNDQDFDGADFTSRITQADALKKLQAIEKAWGDAFTAGFQKAGYTLTDTPGAGVLRVNSAIINIYINAPDRDSPGMSQTFVPNAGQATMVIELRDAATNTLLARIIDSEETQRNIGMPANAVTNLNAFRELADRWTKISVKGLQALQNLSPIPKTLTPGQKLP
jgi:hypothetical protein